ncbi:sensor domain-containing phosphodiesterase [Halobacillus salinus]|uniref:sensor domain-containing phosphodiesterase n=1 Tax=Halobacillus salinus TaxID=192814 RepID=UPI0009A58E78|nr:GGDEF and EAL domain-containing protein [Halobacillus salinus]
MTNNQEDFSRQLLDSLRGRNHKNAIHYLLEQTCLYFQCDAASIYLLEKPTTQTIHPYKEFVRNTNLYPLSYFKRDLLLQLSNDTPTQVDASIYGENAASYGLLLHDDNERPLGALVLINQRPFELNKGEALRTISSCLSKYVSPIQSSTDWNSSTYIEERIRRQQSDFMRLMKDERLTSIDLVPAFQMICESTVETLQVDRVGIWFYHNDHSTLQCLAMYDRPAKKTLNLSDLQKNQFPTYFSSLEENRSIVIEDTQNDFRVSELRKEYLLPHDIRAMMDIPIISGGETIGVLCCEQHTNSRSWTFDEEAFATSIGDLIAFINEHIKRRKAEKEAKHLAYTDLLTNFPNRNALEEKLDSRIEQADTSQAFALLYFNIDNFLEMKERLGYRIGDQLIMAVARRLKSERQPEEFISKLEYDGFILMTDFCERKVSLYERIQQYKKLFREPFVVDHQEFFITVSIGVAIFPEDGDSPATLIRNTSRANTEAKRLGRSMTAFYQPSLDESEFGRQWFHMDLTKALEEEQFRLYFQPQVNTKSNEVTGLEALIRWEHPERGTISPADFIPLAEVTGLIVPLGQWTLRKATEQILDLEKLGFMECVVSVNISAVEFQQPIFVDQLENILQEAGVSPGKLRLEITETIAMDYEEFMIEQLNRLNELGVSVALDDFGTGYSSLKYLSLFPIHCLKIDRSFIKDATTNAKNEGITRSIIDLAEHLQLEVVAEGIETEEDLLHVQSMGGQTIQGYYFSKPLPPYQLNEWLSNFYKS